MNNLFPRLSCIFSLIFLSCFVAVHFLQPEVSFFAKTYSDEIFGNFGYLVTVSLFAFALAQFLFVKPCYELTRSKRLSYFLILGGIGSLLAALFPTTVDKNLNLIRSLHVVGAACQFLFLPLALLTYGNQQKILRLRNLFKILGIITLCFFIIFAVLFLTGFDQKIGFFGFLEKIDIIILDLSLIVWSFAISLN